MKNSSTRQRRMDAIARLLDSDRVKSPCIALAVVKNNLIVGVNTPFIKDKTNLEEEMIKISKILVQKITILQSFLQSLENDIKNKQNVNLEQIVNDSYSRLKSLGFSSRFQYTKYQNEERFKMDLRKVSLSFLKSLISKKESGFSTNEQIEKLIKARPIILFPDQSQENTLEGKLHADQIVLIATLRVLSGENISQLTQITAPLALISIDEKNIPEEPIPIGLPKLSCVVCATNLEQFTQYVSYRGSSGIILNRTISSLISKKAIPKEDIVKEYRGLYEKNNDINTHQNVVYSVHMSKSLITHIDDSASEDEGIGRILHELTLFKTKKNHTDDSDDATWRARSTKSLNGARNK